MLLARRLAALEAAQKDRMDRMSEAEIMAVLDRTCSEGAGHWFDTYLDGLPIAALEAIATGDPTQSALAWEAFDVWQGLRNSTDRLSERCFDSATD